jgi:hypothetical protein
VLGVYCYIDHSFYVCSVPTVRCKVRHHAGYSCLPLPPTPTQLSASIKPSSPFPPVVPMLHQIHLRRLVEAGFKVSGRPSILYVPAHSSLLCRLASPPPPL